MKVFLVAGAILVLYIVGSGIRFAWLASTGKGLAEQAVTFERRDEGATFKILVVGDSSAVGVGASDPQHSLPGLLGTRLPAASIENIAVSGERTAAVARQLDSASQPHYDLALLQIGGNDVTHVTPIQNATRDLAATIDLLKARSDNVIVLTSGDFASAPIWPWPLNLFYGQHNRKLQKAFAATSAEHGATYVSIVEYEDAHGIKKDASYYAADGFHPNDKGYAGWFDAVEETLSHLGL